MSALPPSTELLTEEFLQDFEQRELAVHYRGEWRHAEVSLNRFSTTPKVRWLSYTITDWLGQEQLSYIEAPDFHKIKCWYLLPIIK